MLAANAFQGTGTGKVIGVFHHGWYLSARSAVWMLHNSLMGEIPFGIGVEKYEEKIPYCKEIEGTDFFWKGRSLVFPGLKMTIALQPPEHHGIIRETDLWKLKITQTHIRAVLLDSGRGYLKNLLEENRMKASGIPRQNCVIDRYEVRSEEKICNFLNALYARDAVKMRTALEKLVGFGQGLTPSLDDWLCGFIYTLQRAWVDEAMEGQTRMICREIREIAPKQTNKISAAYLLSIAQGAYFELLEKAIFSASAGELDTLMSVGSSSGSDMLTGIAFALSYVEKYTELK